MFVSFDLHKFQKVYETLDYEIKVSEGIEWQLRQLLRAVSETDATLADFIRKRIAFSKDLTKELRERRKLLEQVEESFSASTRHTSGEIDDALSLLKKIEKI